MQRTLCSALPHAAPGSSRPAAGLGAPPSRAGDGDLPRRPRPQRPGPGRGQGREADVVPPEETTVEVVGTATANAAGARRDRGDRPGDHAADRAGRDATRRALAPHAQRRPADPARPRAGHLAAPRASGRGGSWPRPRCAASATTLDAAGFTEIQTPKFVASATESGANVFEVDYFGRPAYLAQSPQFYKQQLVGVFERVYEVGPVFRAEPHDTVRHLAEYVSLDVELGFIDDHRDVLAVLRDVVAGMVAAVHEHAAPAVERTGADVPVVPEEIPVIHFRDALALVGSARGRAGPRARARAGARRLGAGRARQRLRRGRGLPDGEAAVLHPPLAAVDGPAAGRQQLRPDLPRARAGHGRAAAAPAVGVRRRDPRPRRGPGDLRVVPRRRSSTACRRTAGSRSAWSGGRAG